MGWKYGVLKMDDTFSIEEVYFIEDPTKANSVTTDLTIRGENIQELKDKLLCMMNDLEYWDGIYFELEQGKLVLVGNKNESL